MNAKTNLKAGECYEDTRKVNPDGTTDTTGHCDSGIRYSTHTSAANTDRQ